MEASRRSQRVAHVYAGAVLLVLAATAVSTLVARVQMLRWLRDVQDRALFAAALLLLGLLVAAAIRLGSQPLPERFAPMMTALALALAALSIATTALHRPHAFDVGDNSHYVLGAKYARELRYDKHYECVGLAYRELGLTPPRRYRNLRTNETRKLNVAPGSRAERRCHRAFSAARWRQLKGDVALFDSWQSRHDVEHRFRDHGYNGTPVWSALAGTILNAWPLSDHFQTVLGLFALFFVGFPTVRYYYMGLVALPLAVHAAPCARSSRLVLAVFAAISALCFALHPYAHHAFLHNTLITMGLTAILGVLAWPAVAAAVTARPGPSGQPARVPPPIGSATVHRGLASDG